MDLDTYHTHMAAQKARVAAIQERADAKLRRLGGETVSPSRGSLSKRLAEGLTAEELEKDSASIRNVLRAWRLTGKRATGVSTIQLPSGKVLRKDWSGDGAGGLERAIGRTPKHLRPKRRHQG